MFCRAAAIQTTVFESRRAAKKNGQLVVFRAHIAAYKFCLFLRASLHSDALSDVPILRRIGEILWGEGLPFSIFPDHFGPPYFASGLHIILPPRSTVFQSTARRVAQGDLKARVPSFCFSRRYDELAALAKDFDSMVIRLDSLIQTQKEPPELGIARNYALL